MPDLDSRNDIALLVGILLVLAGVVARLAGLIGG